MRGTASRSHGLSVWWRCGTPRTWTAQYSLLAIPAGVPSCPGSSQVDDQMMSGGYVRKPLVAAVAQPLLTAHAVSVNLTGRPRLGYDRVRVLMDTHLGL